VEDAFGPNGKFVEEVAVLKQFDHNSNAASCHWHCCCGEVLNSGQELQLQGMRCQSLNLPHLAWRLILSCTVLCFAFSAIVLLLFVYACRREALAWGDPSLLLSAVKGAVVQLQRKGLYVVDGVLLKPGAAAAAAAGASTAVGDDVGSAETTTAAAAGAAAEGITEFFDDVAVVPTGAEDLKAAAAAAAAAGGPEVPLHRVPLAPGLSIGDVQQLVLFAIPDGHIKHESMS
jgi:hypothetical protein